MRHVRLVPSGWAPMPVVLHCVLVLIVVVDQTVSGIEEKVQHGVSMGIVGPGPHLHR